MFIVLATIVMRFLVLNICHCVQYWGYFLRQRLNARREIVKYSCCRSEERERWTGEWADKQYL